MSSGNYAGPAGFNNTEKPNSAAACNSAPEPRGPAVKDSALCCTCGRLTIRRDCHGLARHRLLLPIAAVGLVLALTACTPAARTVPQPTCSQDHAC